MAATPHFAPAAEARYRELVEGIRDYAICLLSPEGTIAAWNTGAELITGFPAAEVVGRHVSVCYTPEDVEAGKPPYELEVAAKHGRYVEEGWRVRQGGGAFPAYVTLTALRDSEGQLTGYSQVTRDNTDLRNAIEALRQSEEWMQLMVEAARSEAQRLREAQLAIQIRDEFLSIAGHELRTPLAALLMQVQGLARGERIDDPQVKLRLEKAAAAGLRLEKLIGQMLDVSRISAGQIQLEPEPLQLDGAVREVVERLAEAATAAQCELTLRLEAVAGTWDRLRLEQVITNLVTNALKYGRGRPVEIETKVEGGSAILRVRDHGIGIAADDQPRIFGRFERARDTREYGGFGLGLWIARQIVVASGGRITLQSELGQGATFTVELPLAKGGVDVAAAAQL